MKNIITLEVNHYNTIKVKRKIEGLLRMFCIDFKWVQNERQTLLILKLNKNIRQERILKIGYEIALIESDPFI